MYIAEVEGERETETDVYGVAVWKIKKGVRFAIIINLE